MASVRLESICCLFDNNTNEWHKSHLNMWTEYTMYNILCSLSASVSILGSIYQLFPRATHVEAGGRNEDEQMSSHRQNYIINWLAVADLLASLGILVRAAVWLAGYNPRRDITDHVDFQHIFCAASSGWIQFCYVCTYFWTFLYAVDVYRLVNKKSSCGGFYHIFGWVIPGLLCLMGLLPYYTPALTKCGSELKYALPHYLVTYIPMLLVMIGNPVLYYLAQREVQATLRSRGLYTNQERVILRNIQKKFAFVMLVFYVCWLPNIIDGIMILFRNPNNIDFMIGLWNFMALVNPLQAFLNSLVYRGVSSCPSVCCTSSCCQSSASGPTGSIIQASHGALEESTEVSPLLSFRKSGHYSSRSGNYSGQEQSPTTQS